MNGRAVFVMGMGRSGTSNLAGILQTLGIPLGPEELLLQAGEANPKGFWELIPFMQVNDEILRRFGGDWHHPPWMPLGWQHEAILNDLYVRVHELLDLYFSTTELWGFKDPRTCITFPFWRKALDDQIDCVFSFRNPLEVAFSLMQRDKFPLVSGLQLWLRNVTESLVSTEGLKRHFLFYEDLLSDFENELGRLAKFLGIEEVPDDRMKAVREFTEDSLRHNRKSLEELFQNGVPFSVKAAYVMLRVAAGPSHGDADMKMVTALLQHWGKGLTSPEVLPQ